MNWKKWIIAALALLTLGGCSNLLETIGFAPNYEPHGVPYHENSLNSLAQGRQYQTQGRYELARETFLQGLATARDKDLRARLAEEIEATDRLILSRR